MPTGHWPQVNGAGTPEYLLDDALGSRRGVTNLAGTLTGTADYDTFGAIRTSAGAGSTFGYTGEQFDGETGYTYLRARYLNPALGRFTSADTVQPSAPGTQGFNLYAYVANNPTMWVDPSGHQVAVASVAPAFFEWLSARGVYAAVMACTIKLQGCATTLSATVEMMRQGKWVPGIVSWGVGLGFSVYICIVAVPGCADLMMKFAKIDFASPGGGGGGGGGGGPECMDPFDVIDALSTVMDLLNLGTAAIPQGQKYLDAAFGNGKSLSPTQADTIGRAWVGGGYSTRSNGTTLWSQNELRQYRPPALKKGTGVTQANLEWRFQNSGRWPGDVHINIDSRC